MYTLDKIGRPRLNGKSNERVTDEVLLEALFNSLIDADIIGPDNDWTSWLESGRRWRNRVV